MIQTRIGVFETNSSSTHSLVIGTTEDVQNFLGGKAYLNVITGKIVYQDDLENEKNIIRDLIKKFCYSCRYTARGYCEKPVEEILETADYWSVRSHYYNMSSIVDDAIDSINWDEIKISLGSQSLSNIFVARGKSAEKFQNQIIDIATEKTFLKYEDVVKECELHEHSDIIHVDNNGTKYSAISIFGSDSYNFGWWPSI